MTQLRKSVPANVAAALAKALEKLPADRFESARAFSDALNNPAFSIANAKSAETARTDVSRHPVVDPKPVVVGRTRDVAGRRRLLSFLLFAPVPIRGPGAEVGKAAVVRFTVPVNPDTGRRHLDNGYQHLWVTELTISPDGGRIVYAALGPDSVFALYQRRFDQDKAEVLLVAPTARHYERPFFSPDGAWVGFVDWVRTGSGFAGCGWQTG